LQLWSLAQSGDSQPEPVERQLEVCRCQAEALLVHNRLDQVILDVDEREKLTRRAIGIQPDTEKERVGEILASPELRPSVFARSTGGLMRTLEAVSSRMNPATALFLGMMVRSGTRASEQLDAYADKLDQLFSRVISAPSVIQALDRAVRPIDKVGAGTDQNARFQSLFGILLAVRDRLWKLKPARPSTPFLLSQVLDHYLGPQREVGNSLGLAVLDAILVGKLGFQVRFHIESEIVSLEILIQNKSVYWDVTRPTPLSFVPLSGARPIELEELYGILIGSMAAANFAQGRLKRAIELYEQVVERTPDSARTWNSLAACHIRNRCPEDALKAVERAVELDPEQAPAWYTRGNAEAMMQRWPRAIAAFKKALALRPDYVEVYNNLGFAFQRSGAHEQAIAAFQAAIDMRPEYVQAHFNLGNIHLELEQYEDAVRHYRDATRIQPNMAQAWYNMGQAHYRMDDLDAAIGDYRKAVAINPKHFGAWHNLGIAYRDKGLKDKAVEALEKAVTINPNLIR